METKTVFSPPPNIRVKWYRTPLDKETLARLNAKSDLKGLMQCLGHLGLIALAGGAAVHAAANWPWWSVIIALFAYGTTTSFAINAVHELVHKCVFRTQWLNQFFVRVFSFLGWINFEHFYASHMRHHQYTLHQPDDLEVTLPIKVLTQHFFKYTFFNLLAIRWQVKNSCRLACGNFEGAWEATMFPENEPEKALPTIRWARFLLIGHATVIAVSLVMAWLFSPLWLMALVLITLNQTYGSSLQFLCNNTQHIGLQDEVPDFRQCCRTFTVNPLVQFLYWHMNYHIEHHMYAAVPCYNLGTLHRAIKHELPPTPHGLVATWQEIAEIQRKQAADPTYQHIVPLPGRNAAVPEGEGVLAQT